MASHLASLWNRGLGQLRNGLLKSIAGVNIKRRHAYDNGMHLFRRYSAGLGRPSPS